MLRLDNDLPIGMGETDSGLSLTTLVALSVMRISGFTAPRERACLTPISHLGYKVIEASQE